MILGPGYIPGKRSGEGVQALLETPVNHNPGSPLARYLRDQGLVSAEVVERAEALSRSNGSSFEQTMIQLGVLSREEVFRLRLRAEDIDTADLDELDVPAELLRQLPAEAAYKYRVFPLGESDSTVRLAMVDPFDMAVVDDLQLLFDRRVARVYATEADILEAIGLHYGTTFERMIEDLDHSDDSSDPTVPLDNEAVGHLHEIARDPSLVNLVNLIIIEAVKRGASDIHIEPFEDLLKVKYRIDGILHEMPSPPTHLRSAIVSRIKILADMNIAERYIPQDGHIEFTMPEKKIDMRVATVPTLFGESVAMRILDKSAMNIDLDRLGLSADALRRVRMLLGHSHGIILVVGPTGSGKTTTLYAGLQEIYTSTKKIITIEDPVEYQLPGINQIPVRPKRGLTFANGLRAIVRQDPDIIMVGEIRDSETADISIRSALTGHLVFSTLHTNDAASAPARLLDMGVEPFLLSSSLQGVVAQRLVRRICPICKEEHRPDPAAARQIANLLDCDPPDVLWRGRGCQQCLNTGYSGRTGIFEIILVDAPLRELMTRKVPTSAIAGQALTPASTMRADGFRKALDGVTTFEEVLRATRELDLG